MEGKEYKIMFGEPGLSSIISSLVLEHLRKECSQGIFEFREEFVNCSVSEIRRYHLDKKILDYIPETVARMEIYDNGIDFTVKNADILSRSSFDDLFFEYVKKTGSQRRPAKIKLRVIGNP